MFMFNPEPLSRAPNLAAAGTDRLSGRGPTHHPAYLATEGLERARSDQLASNSLDLAS
jgi:hypothetical protein